jgi:TPP-dependent 2-oxoacid decarboxylase
LTTFYRLPQIEFLLWQDQRQERMMSATVAELLVGVLEQIGVRHIFGLIGDSLNPLADAVRRSKIDWIGVRHEEGAALAAAGQAKLTGQLGVCDALLASFSRLLIT